MVTWSRWYKFSDIFEFHGLVADSNFKSPNSKQKITIGNKTGHFNTDNGFRLLSKKYYKASFGSYKPEIECPLHEEDIGVYWINIFHLKQDWNYIGLSEDSSKDGSIYSRLIDHFSKLIGLNSKNRNFKKLSNNQIYSTTREYTNSINIKKNKWNILHQYFEKKGITTASKSFFEESGKIKIAFIKLNKDKDLIQLIEALSMKLYAIEKIINDKSYNFEFISDDFANKNIEEKLKYIEKIGIPELNHKDEFQIIYNQITNNQFEKKNTKDINKIEFNSKYNILNKEIFQNYENIKGLNGFKDLILNVLK